MKLGENFDFGIMDELREKIDVLRDKLKEIAKFDHAEDCSHCAPLYECGCFEKDQWAMAEEALDLLDDVEELM